MRFDPALCPDCNEVVDWEVLHETRPGAPRSHATLRCPDCGRQLRGTIEWPSEVGLHCVLSTGALSSATTLEWPSDQRVRVGDEGFHEDHRVQVTGIEHKDGRRVPWADPGDVGTVWAKLFDELVVKVSLNEGQTTSAHEVPMAPEDVIHIGDILDIGGRRMRVDHIKTGRGIVHKGAVDARSVVRLYCKPGPKPPPAQ